MKERQAPRARSSRSWLFVPGDRSERFDRARAAGAGLVVVDLEDAVPPESKGAARENLAALLASGARVAVRINAPGSEWFADDLEAVRRPGAAVMVPKSESSAVLDTVAAQLTGQPLIALVETARGVLDAAGVAHGDGVERLAFGSFDLAAELGVDPDDREAMASARGMLVLASAAAGLPGPIDGVTGDLSDERRLRADVNHARRLGFSAKLCIHPRQVAVEEEFRPGATDLQWAAEVSSCGVGA